MKELFTCLFKKSKESSLLLEHVFLGGEGWVIMNFSGSRPHRAFKALERDFPTAPITILFSSCLTSCSVSDQCSLFDPRAQWAMQVLGEARRTPLMALSLFKPRITGQQEVSKWFLFWVMVFLVVPRVCEPLFCISNNRDSTNLATCFTVVRRV